MNYHFRVTAFSPIGSKSRRNAFPGRRGKRRTSGDAGRRDVRKRGGMAAYKLPEGGVRRGVTDDPAWVGTVVAEGGDITAMSASTACAGDKNMGICGTAAAKDTARAENDGGRRNEALRSARTGAVIKRWVHGILANWENFDRKLPGRAGS